MLTLDLEELRKVYPALVRGSMPVDRDLMLDDFEVPAPPKVSGFDIVIRVGVESFVGQSEFVELMDPQKDGVKVPRVSHEGSEGGVGSIFSET